MTRLRALFAVRLSALFAVSVLLSSVDFTFARTAGAVTSCGDFYRIKPGDTLRAITLKALGHDRYAVLFRANRDILPSPERIVVGQLIYVPCPETRIKSRARAFAEAGRRPSRRDNRGDRWALQSAAAPNAEASRAVTVISPGSSQQSSLVRTAAQGQTKTPTPSEPTAPKDGDMLLLTASGLDPLVDERLPDGGLVSVILREALRASDDAPSLRPAFVEDRRAHLDILMPTGAFDLGYPWPAPDCSSPAPGALSERLCADFVYSRPLYEIDIVALVPNGSALSSDTGADELKGIRVCRPEGFPAVDIEAAGWPVTVIEARSAADCMDMLRSSTVDLLSLPEPWAEGAAALGLREIAALASTIPVHAIALRSDPGADAAIRRLNEGLLRLQRSGRWFSLVSAYLSAYNAGQAAQN